METGVDIKFYRERWKAVEEFERQELRAMTMDEHWRQINSIFQFALSIGWTRGNDDHEMEVFNRWAILKGAL